MGKIVLGRCRAGMTVEDRLRQAFGEAPVARLKVLPRALYWQVLLFQMYCDFLKHLDEDNAREAIASWRKMVCDQYDDLSPEFWPWQEDAEFVERLSQLRQIGLEVVAMRADQIAEEDLRTFRALILTLPMAGTIGFESRARAMYEFCVKTSNAATRILKAYGKDVELG